ncbi:alpha/beta hydrolase [Nonomuraea turkmeniaca]|uniref:Alpha/beta hydrolase n=1 Tax=Nonomuraea turkmeniaca TaxID=103838 RepID=A0A5S4F587_9ACTN|nr:alpha/beta fold hydrolase [Nonomuraea turkmeniaca]TMR11233.1 alpha/beta hydrolase [Nonomuraea turkmeniaca]
MRGMARSLAAGLATAALAGLSPPAAADGSSIEWKQCAGENAPDGMQCATVTVPLDWADPGGKKITLDLARFPATDPGRRIGSVLHVPGGPGGKGIEDLKRFAPDMSRLRERFDLVTSNPRNTDLGAKLPEVCARPAVAHLAEPRSRAEYDAQAAAFAKAMRECRDQDRSGLYTRLDSVSVARDMEAIRAALGERRLSFMAESYGGVPATAYMRLFPHRIRAMYLDGVINQPDGWSDQWLLAYPETERALTRFTTWCQATAACALHGEDAGKIWRALTERADRAPIPVTSKPFGKGRLTGSYLRWFGFSGDPGPGHARWLAFAEAVDKARRGDGSGFADAALGNARVWSMPNNLGMTCGDDRGYRTYAEYRKERERAREVSPSFGTAGFDLIACSGWPFPVPNPSRLLPTAGLPPMLGAGTWSDYPWTESLIRRIPGSAAIRYEGPGHVLYMSGNRCAIEHATRYLIDLTLPRPGTVCLPEQG